MRYRNSAETALRRPQERNVYCLREVSHRKSSWQLKIQSQTQYLGMRAIFLSNTHPNRFEKEGHFRSVEYERRKQRKTEVQQRKQTSFFTFYSISI